jgi:hypothetical protein
LWQTGNDPPPVDVLSAPLDVVVGFESPSVEEVFAPGFALIVVASPLIVVRIGVIVATGLPLASTETQGSRGDSVTGIVKLMPQLDRGCNYLPVVLE